MAPKTALVWKILNHFLLFGPFVSTDQTSAEAGTFLAMKSERDELFVDKNTDLTSGTSDEVQRERQR